MSLGKLIQRIKKNKEVESEIKSIDFYVSKYLLNSFQEIKKKDNLAGEDFVIRCSDLPFIDVVSEIKSYFLGSSRKISVSPKMGYIYEVGKYYHELVRNNLDNVYGIWICSKCFKIFGDFDNWVIKPKQCDCGFTGFLNIFGDTIHLNKFQYIEPFKVSNHLSGHLDAVFKISGKWVIVDFKTCNKEQFIGFCNSGPSMSHIIQIHGYMELFDIKQAKVMYINKNTDDILFKEFWIFYNLDIINEIKRRIEYIKRCIEEERIIEEKFEPLYKYKTDFSLFSE